MGDKPGKYWDYNDCRWVKCPESPGARSTTQADDVSVPVQQDAESAEADDQTIVVSPS